MKKDQIIYVKEDEVNFRKPSTAPNGVEKMKAGQELIFMDGPWFRITKDGQRGWVHGDYLTEVTPVQSSLSPDLLNFVKGQAHPANHSVTKSVREIIKDEFGLGKTGDFLNCTEYVQYRIKTKLGVIIQWPVRSGRDGGKWWKIFQDAGLYKILVDPQVSCAVCFTEIRRKDGTLTKEGHIAFVEEVGPDGSMKISEANWPHDGIYNERPISRADWQNKYKARFIDFS